MSSLQHTPGTQSRTLLNGNAKRTEYLQEDNLFTINTQISNNRADNQGQYPDI